jgi:imidazoleglycerol-phosphate dehydratase
MPAFFREQFLELVMAERTACVERNTLETQVKVSINLDGTGKAKFDIGVPFLEHMLDQIARHGLIDLDIQCKGDLHIDDHHTVEDVGITLGQAFTKAIGDKKGMTRYGHSYVPLDEALSRVVIDFSGRPGLQMHVPFTRAVVGGFDVDLFQEFFQGFVNHALVSLHIDNLRGTNTPSPDRNGVQGLRPRSAHGHRTGPAHGRADAVDQGLPVNANRSCD